MQGLIQGLNQVLVRGLILCVIQSLIHRLIAWYGPRDWTNEGANHLQQTHIFFTAQMAQVVPSLWGAADMRLVPTPLDLF